jgi:hypothetical protein
MTRVDIPADLNSEDETGFVSTFLDEAEDPSVIVPGGVVVAGSPLTPAVCEVVDLVEKAAGTIVQSPPAPRHRRAVSEARPSNRCVTAMALTRHGVGLGPQRMSRWSSTNEADAAADADWHEVAVADELIQRGTADAEQRDGLLR